MTSTSQTTVNTLRPYVMCDKTTFVTATIVGQFHLLHLIEQLAMVRDDNKITDILVPDNHSAISAQLLK